MTTSHPVLPGQEAFAIEATPSPEHPERARVGIGLVHGFTGNPYSMRLLAEELAKNGFYVDAPRLPGHGTSVEDLKRTRYADWRAEVAALVERLKARSERVVLVGLSGGGTLALDLASEVNSKVDAVATINVQILERDGFLVKLAPLLEKLLPTAPSAFAGLRKDDIAKPGVSERAYAEVATAAGNSFLRELPRIREALLNNLRCPLLVAYSPQDHSVPPENSRSLSSLLVKHNPIELVLERSYHVATLDYDLPLLVDHVTKLADAVAR